MATLKQLFGLESWGAAKPGDSDWSYKERQKAGEETSQRFRKNVGGDYPPQGQLKGAHEGSQSNAPNKEEE